MNNTQIVNKLLKMRSEIDDLLKELSYNGNKTFKEMPISHNLLFALKMMELENATPIEFVSKVSQSEFKRSRNVGPKSFKEMSILLSKVGLEWHLVFA